MFKKAGRLSLFLLIVMMSSCSAVKAKMGAAPYSGTTAALKPLIVLDAGHGGPDIGTKLKFPKVEEKRFNLKIALKAKKFLEHLGYRVVMTRTKDVFIPLKRQVYIANKSNSEVFVSLHFNSCANKDVHGVEIFYSDMDKNPARNTASRKLAEMILARVIFRSQAATRGVKKGSWCVIRDTRMPSVLFEGGFVTNKAELARIRRDDYLDKLAKGIAEGIDAFVRA